MNIYISIPKLICYQVKQLQIPSSTICRGNCCLSFNQGAVNLDLLLGSCWFIIPWICIISQSDRNHFDIMSTAAYLEHQPNHFFLKFTLICTFLKQFAFVDTKVLSSTVLLVNLDFISKVCVLIRQVHIFPKIDHCDNCIAVWCCFVNPPWVLGQTKCRLSDCMSSHGTAVPT